MTDHLETLVDQMTLEEQVSLLAGEDLWSVNAIARLDVGKIRVTDGPNGARGGGDWFGGVTAAAFPVGIAMGATWNPDLAYEVGAALAQETKSKCAHVLLAPTINIHRSVTNGRNFECFAEDPELTAKLTVPYIRGLQDNGIAATPKHYAGNESEIQRTTMNSEIDERSLREVYLRPFEAAVKDANTWAMMSSYNRLNTQYTSENEWLLSDVLRDDWGYDGIVMSDWFGSHSTAETVNAGLDLEMPGPTRDRGDKLVAAVQEGKVAPDTVRTRALNMLHLMDRTGALTDKTPYNERSVDLPETRALIRRAGAEAAVLLKNENLLPLSTPSGKIAVIGPNAAEAQIMGGGSSYINAHYRVSPLQALQDRFGAENIVHAPGCQNHRWEPLFIGDVDVAYFDNATCAGDPVATETLGQTQTFWMPPIGEGKVNPTGFSARISWKYTATTTGMHRFGLHATGPSKLYVDGTLVVNAADNWTRGRTFFEEGCDEITADYALTAGETYAVTVEFAARKSAMLDLSAFRAGIGVPLGVEAIEQAVNAAKAADTAIIFAGRSGEWDTEGSDLQDIMLPGAQDALIAAVLAANPNTVVVLQTGGPVEMPWINEAKAVLQAWYPGQEAGNAICDVLFGDTEPGGRLPQTFPVKWQDNPTWSQDPEIYPGLDGKTRYEEGVFIGYRHYDRHGITPMFPFGHGLGYTSFALSDCHAEHNGDGTRVNARLTNTGKRQGTTVVQLYIGDTSASVPRPIKELKTFAKIALAPGETRDFTLDLSGRDFAFFDVDTGVWRVEEGEFEIHLGFSATDIACTTKITMQATTYAK
ncbi:beta-glucosidase [Loktanella sp. S4079]|uniref:beta-glucosidase n=1 Tax=Loktanella sp. S4079 TaxID=579483 RepID=UPI0005FA3DF7|nr:glycoside hydrolase family 3 C-terminal domain-containing protein [Loktanella sp. S4079]KJZ21234.1 beta-glucosidase [Loktanella sp. S4079]